MKRNILAIVLILSIMVFGYSHAALALPHLIEATTYKNYFDKTSQNRGNNSTRAGSVDLGIHNGIFNEPTPYNKTKIDFVGWIQPGEWLEYSVYVKKDGTYRVNPIVASPNSSGSYYLTFINKDSGNSRQTTGVVSIDSTGTWYDYRVQQGSKIDLHSGSYTMRITMLSGGFNLFGFGTTKVLENRENNIFFEDFSYKHKSSTRDSFEGCMAWFTSSKQGVQWSFGVNSVANEEVLLAGPNTKFKTRRPIEIAEGPVSQARLKIDFFAANGAKDRDQIHIYYRIKNESWTSVPVADSNYTYTNDLNNGNGDNYYGSVSVQLGDGDFNAGDKIDLKVEVATQMPGIYMIDDISITGNYSSDLVQTALDVVTNENTRITEISTSGNEAVNVEVRPRSRKGFATPVNDCVRAFYDHTLIKYTAAVDNAELGDTVEVLNDNGGKAVPILWVGQGSDGVQAISFILPTMN